MENSTVRCNMCNWEGSEEELKTFVDLSDNDISHDVGYFSGCPNCETDDYLMDISDNDLDKLKSNQDIFKDRFGTHYDLNYDEFDDEPFLLFSEFEEQCEIAWNENEDLQKYFKTSDHLLNHVICNIEDGEHPITFIQQIDLE